MFPAFAKRHNDLSSLLAEFLIPSLAVLDVIGSFRSRLHSPRLNISPSRLAFRCMTTPLRFWSHNSPALVVPRAKP
jgi:hypothetical protein